MFQELICLFNKTPAVIPFVLAIILGVLVCLARLVFKLESEIEGTKLKQQNIMIEVEKKMLENEKNFVTREEYREDIKEMKDDMKNFIKRVESSLDKIEDRLFESIKEG